MREDERPVGRRFDMGERGGDERKVGTDERCSDERRFVSSRVEVTKRCDPVV